MSRRKNKTSPKMSDSKVRLNIYAVLLRLSEIDGLFSIITIDRSVTWEYRLRPYLPLA